MKVVSIGDLVVDFYYMNNQLLGINGGMSSHNIIANLSSRNINTAVFGVCGNDMLGQIALKSLQDLNVNVDNVKILDDIKTRCFHVSYFDHDNNITFTSKKRCPICNNKRWYEESRIDVSSVIDKLDDEDIVVFDNLNKNNQQIIDNISNIKILDMGQYFELDEYSNQEIVNKINNKFKIINLNERVEKYFFDRFNTSSILDIYNLLNPELLIVTRGEEGVSFVYNQVIINKHLDNSVVSLDPTGAGDAFLSVYIYEYINNGLTISEDYINRSFKIATKLTSKVVKKMGARGHLSKLYKIKKKADCCICEDFDISVRKQIKRCSVNINNLETRVLNALKSSAYKNISKVEFLSCNTIGFIGTGGSFAVANFASKVINHMYGVNTIALYPRDLLYRNVSNIDKIFLFSYSGTTKDVIEGSKNIDVKDKYIITKGVKQKIVSKTGITKENIFSYRSSINKASEKGFLSFEGVVAPASLLLRLYLEQNNNINVFEFINQTFTYWDNYFDMYFKNNKEKLKKMLIKGNIINVFTGDYVTSAGFDFESKIIESGVFNILVHEKKNFSHGRFINYENLSKKINIYFKQKDVSSYEKELINYLDNENMIIIESNYNGILCEYDLLVASQFLIYYISNFLDIDFSKPNYSEETLKIYLYNGDL